MNKIFLFFTLILASNLTAMDKPDKLLSQKNPVIEEVKKLATFVSDTINDKTVISNNKVLRKAELTMPKEVEQSINNQTIKTEKEIEKLIKSNKIFIELPDSLGRTPLMQATIHMQSSIVTLLLLKYNAPTNSTDLLGNTAMYYAQKSFNESIESEKVQIRGNKGGTLSLYLTNGTPLFGCKEFLFRNKDIEICLQLIHEKNQQPMKDLLSD